MLKHLTLVKVENNNCKDVQISLFIYFLTEIGTLMIKLDKYGKYHGMEELPS
jgi:hypothetical protein